MQNIKKRHHSQICPNNERKEPDEIHPPPKTPKTWTKYREWLDADVLQILLSRTESLFHPESIILWSETFEKIKGDTQSKNPNAIVTAELPECIEWTDIDGGFLITFSGDKARTLRKNGIKSRIRLYTRNYASLEQTRLVGQTLILAICRKYKLERTVIQDGRPKARNWLDKDALRELLRPNEDTEIEGSVKMEVDENERKGMELAGLKILDVVPLYGSISKAPRRRAVVYEIRFTGEYQCADLLAAGFQTTFRASGPNAYIKAGNMHKAICRRMGWLDVIFDISLPEGVGFYEEPDVDVSELLLNQRVIEEEFDKDAEESIVDESDDESNESNDYPVNPVELKLTVDQSIPNELLDDMASPLAKADLAGYMLAKVEKDLRYVNGQVMRLKPHYQEVATTPQSTASGLSAFVDGDGCISITNRGAVLIMLSQSGHKTPLILRYFNLLFGGTLKYLGYPKGFDPAKVRPRWRLVFARWSETKVVAEIIRDNAILKSFQAKAALKMMEGRKPGRIDEDAVKSARFEIGTTLGNKTSLYQAIGRDQLTPEKFTDAYIAFLFDAEGCVQISKSYRPFVAIGQYSSPTILKALAERFGGHVVCNSEGEPTSWISPSNREDVIRIVDMLLQYCIQKRDQLLELRKFLYFSRHRHVGETDEWKRFVNVMRSNLAAMKRK